VLILTEAFLTGAKKNDKKEDEKWIKPLVGEMPELAVHVNSGDFSGSEGCGCWVGYFMEFLQEKVRELTGNERFRFRYTDSISVTRVKDIVDENVRAMIIQFINERYQSWYENDVEIPSWDRARDRCGHICDGCDRIPEGETCDEDCDAMYDRVCEYISENTNVNTDVLHDYFAEFLGEHGHGGAFLRGKRVRNGEFAVQLGDLPPMPPPPASPILFDYNPPRVVTIEEAALLAKAREADRLRLLRERMGATSLTPPPPPVVEMSNVLFGAVAGYTTSTYITISNTTTA
jgi:hypothetical protein